MERLLGSDPDELYAKHLFDLAHICHTSPPEVGALRYVDFINLVLNIERLHRDVAAAKAKGAAGGG